MRHATPLLFTFLSLGPLWGCGGASDGAASEAPDAAQPTPDEATPDEASPLGIFVSVAAAERLLADGATVLDARDEADWAAGHLPGAQAAPWQAFVDGPQSGALDTLDKVQAALRARGVGEGPVLVYGAWAEGWGEEGRMYWTLDHLGHDDVHILEGGIPAWRGQGGELTRATHSPSPGDFTATPRGGRIDTEALGALVQGDGDAVILDNRSREEYDGATPYGAPRGGHIPGATHLYWKDLITEAGLKPEATLRDRLQLLGLDPSKGQTVITYCTGGVRSGFGYAVLKALGHEDVRNYDGSWWAWAAAEALPVEPPVAP